MSKQASHAAEAPEELAGKLYCTFAPYPSAQEHREQFRIA